MFLRLSVRARFLLAFSVVLAAQSSTASAVWSCDSCYVTRNGATGKFSYKGGDYKFIGVNLQGTAWNSGEFAEQMSAVGAAGVTVVRIFLPKSDRTTQDAINTLNSAVTTACSHNIKLIVALTDFYNSGWTVPGDGSYYTPYLNGAWFSGGFRVNYKPFVRTIVGEFGDEPTIFAWELGNELSDANGATDMLKFSYEMGWEIRNSGAQQMVSTGFLSVNHAINGGVTDTIISNFYSSWPEASQYGLPTTSPFSFGSIHCYNYPDDNVTANDYNWYKNTSHPYPYIVGEIGFSGAFVNTEWCSVYGGGAWQGVTIPDCRYGRNGAWSAVANKFLSDAGLTADGVMQWGYMVGGDNGYGDRCFGMDTIWHSDFNSLQSTMSAIAAGLPKGGANCSSGLPDLIVTDVDWIPTNPTQGQEVTLKATIRNESDVAINPGVIVGTNWKIDGTYIGFQTFDTGLGARTSKVITMNSVPYWIATAGTHTVLVTTDDVYRISELNDNNNTWSETLVVSGGGQPDLVVTDIAWVPAVPAVNQATTLKATIYNQGTAATPSDKVIGVIWDDGQTRIGYMTTAPGYSLPALTSLVVTMTVPATWRATPAGIHTIHVMVDDVNRIAESNENNNHRNEALSVGGTNVLANPDFLANDQYWNKTGDVGSETCCAQTPPNTFAGGAYPEGFAHFNGAGGELALWQATGTRTGTFTLRGWIRTDGVHQAYIRADDGRGQYGIIAQTTPTRTTVWTQFSVTFTVTNKQVNIALIADNSSAGGWAVWDNISLAQN